MPDRPQVLRSRDVIRRFDRAAAPGTNAEFLYGRTLEGIVERLAPVQVDARRILDLGSGSGAASRRMARMWRRSRISSVDLSAAMLIRAKRERSRFARIREVRADAAALPFAEASFDVVVANLSLPWFDNPEAALREVARVLRREGLFAFASLGPDSLVEIRDAWASVDADRHVHPFADMHDVGDALVRAGLRDPVLDVERLEFSYENPRALYRDLAAAGGRNAASGRRPGLTGKSRFARFESALRDSAGGGPILVSIELVFGHAWGGGRQRDPAEFAIDPGSIGRRRRNS